MEQEPIPTAGLPIISDEVKNSLLADLNLGVDPVTRRIVSGISGEIPDTPENRSRALVQDIFSDILKTNPGFATGTLTTLKGIKDYYAFRIDGFTIGMAVVISAFDKMSNQSLTEKFGRLSEEDVAEALNTIRDVASLSSDDFSTLELVIKAPRIPEQQINLNEVISKLAKNSLPAEARHIRMGASTMYQILSKNWPKLSGGNNYS